MKFILAKEVQLGDLIKTETGIKEVSAIEKTDKLMKLTLGYEIVQYYENDWLSVYRNIGGEVQDYGDVYDSAGYKFICVNPYESLYVSYDEYTACFFYKRDDKMVPTDSIEIDSVDYDIQVKRLTKKKDDELNEKHCLFEKQSYGVPSKPNKLPDALIDHVKDKWIRVRNMDDIYVCPVEDRSHEEPVVELLVGQLKNGKITKSDIRCEFAIYSTFSFDVKKEIFYDES